MEKNVVELNKVTMVIYQSEVSQVEIYVRDNSRMLNQVLLRK